MKTKTIGRTSGLTVDGYLAALTAEQRAALQRLREIVHGTVPEAEECMSYGIPSFRLRGRYLFGFGAARAHCAFYPGAVVEAFAEELEDFSTSKGTIRFQPDKPLPKALVQRLVKAQVARRVPAKKAGP